MTTTLPTLRRWALPGLLGGLLACQSSPSDTQLLRLRLVDDELMVINDKVGQANEEAVKSMRSMVEKAHNQPQDLAVLRLGQDVRAETQQLVSYLRGLRRQLSPVAGEALTLDQLADRGAVAKNLLRSAQADTLQRRLQRYVAHQQRFFGPMPPESGPGLVRDNPRVEDVSGVPLTGLRFADFYFQDATVVEGRLALAQQEARVLRLESNVLAELSKKVGYVADVFDKISAFASAESNVVGEGEPYRATLLLVAAARGGRLSMTRNGQPVPVGPDGQGRVTFTAPLLPPGQQRQMAYWDGTIILRHYGQDTTFRLRVPYTVVRRAH